MARVVTDMPLSAREGRNVSKGFGKEQHSPCQVHRARKDWQERSSFRMPEAYTPIPAMNSCVNASSRDLKLF